MCVLEGEKREFLRFVTLELGIQLSTFPPFGMDIRQKLKSLKAIIISGVSLSKKFQFDMHELGRF